jgi:hypothetical protein
MFVSMRGVYTSGLEHIRQAPLGIFEIPTFNPTYDLPYGGRGPAIDAQGRTHAHMLGIIEPYPGGSGGGPTAVAYIG